MATAVDVYTEARTWIGTRYHHQARTKGLACDCGGLVGGVAVELGLVPRNWWETVFDPLFGGYARRPTPGGMLRVCDTWMTRAEGALAPGMVIAIEFVDNLPQHLAIVAPYRHGGLSVVHALNFVGEVREHRLPDAWSNKIAAQFWMPGVTP